MDLSFRDKRGCTWSCDNDVFRSSMVNGELTEVKLDFEIPSLKSLKSGCLLNPLLEKTFCWENFQGSGKQNMSPILWRNSEITQSTSELLMSQFIDRSPLSHRSHPRCNAMYPPKGLWPGIKAMLSQQFMSTYCVQGPLALWIQPALTASTTHLTVTLLIS